MLGLRLGPATEDLVDGHQPDLGKAGDVGGVRRFRLKRAVEVAGDDLLRGRRVEVIEEGLRYLAGAALVDHDVDQRHRRLGQDRKVGHHDLELVGAELLQDQEGFVLPVDQYIADSTLGEGRGGAARTRIEYRHVLIDGLDELPRGRLVALGPVELIGPGCEVVPTRAAGGLGVRRHHRDARPGEIGPVLDALGVSLAHDEDDRRCIGRTVVGQALLPVHR